MICPNCNFATDQNVKYCPKCGKPMDIGQQADNNEVDLSSNSSQESSSQANQSYEEPNQANNTAQSGYSQPGNYTPQGYNPSENGYTQQGYNQAGNYTQQGYTQPGTGYTQQGQQYCRNCGRPTTPGAAVCLNCGVAMGNGNLYCPNCGSGHDPQSVVCTQCGVPLTGPGYSSGKSKVAAGLLGIFLGAFGVHNFYLGYTTKAVIQLVATIVGFCLSCFGIGVFVVLGIEIWGFVEGIMILTGSIKTDGNGNFLRD